MFALLKGFNGEEEEPKGFADEGPVEKGLPVEEADEGFTPKSDSPNFWGAGVGAGASSFACVD